MFAKILYRPALAIVISIIIVFLGVLGYISLPRSQFPNIAPPTVLVFITYPGASAEVLVDSTLIPLERSINGVAGMRYMSSDATSAGEATIRIYFEPGTDPDLAVVNVQNRISVVKNLLPALVQREGIIVNQVMPSMLMYVNVYSTNPDDDQKRLFNFTNNFILQEIRRINGIGSATILGSRTYAMRIWLNPEAMQQRKLSTDDVMKAIAEQSVIGSPGRLGQATGIKSQSKEYVLTYAGRYNTVEQYRNIILKVTPEGEIVRLSDVCGIKKVVNGEVVEDPVGVELGSEFFDIYSDINDRPSAAIVLKQNPGSNAVAVIEKVKEKLEEIKKERFEPGMDYEVSYDVSKFLEASIEKVMHTLLEAFILVSIVVFLFLGDLRSTLIPILAVPVSLIGTFFVMQLFGLSINLITLFAMVLAIGVVVDNAIVVVEAVHAKMHEKHLSPYLATQEVMNEISGAIIAITLVMSAVFVPVTFIPGPVGTFYKHFGITMASAIILSGVVALTLTPVLCAMILKPVGKQPKKQRGFLGAVLYRLVATVELINWIAKPFDWVVNKVTAFYTAILGGIVTKRALSLFVIVGFCVGIYLVNMKLPSAFIPGEDQGMIYGIIQTPAGSTLEYTNSKSQKLQEIAMKIEGVTSVSSLAGYEVLTEGRGSNAGTCIINLKPWNERSLTAKQIIEELERKAGEVGNAKIEFFEPPAVPGFGAAGGFSLRLLDQTGNTDYKRLGEVNTKFMEALGKRKELTNLFTFYTSDYPQYELLINNDFAMQKGVSIGKALDNLNILIGSTYEQGFIRFGQFYKVYVQGLPQFRRLPSDLDNLFVKNDKGEMVPYSAFMTVKLKQGLNEITRYNLFSSATIQGAAAPGYSSGQALKAVQEVAKESLPRGYGLGWEGLSYDEVNQGNTSTIIFGIVILFVYLVLVAQYESFFLPFAVILSLPIGLFGSFIFLQFMGLSNDVYAQMGLVMLVGLLGKNAILIVEFAVQRRAEGVSLKQAAIEGAKLRFRPIQMTSFAFIVGLLPLVFATGAGAIGNRTIGTTSAGGMLLGTVLGVLVIPGLYYVFGKLADGRKLLQDETSNPLSEIIHLHSEHHVQHQEQPAVPPKPEPDVVPLTHPDH